MDNEFYMQDLYSDPSYREYWNTLQGIYLGSTIFRSYNIEGGEHTQKISSKTRKQSKSRASDDDFEPSSSSTLNPTIQKLFQESQKELIWEKNIVGSSDSDAFASNNDVNDIDLLKSEIEEINAEDFASVVKDDSVFESNDEDFVHDFEN